MDRLGIVAELPSVRGLKVVWCSRVVSTWVGASGLIAFSVPAGPEEGDCVVAMIWEAKLAWVVAVAASVLPGLPRCGLEPFPPWAC